MLLIALVASAVATAGTYFMARTTAKVGQKKAEKQGETAKKEVPNVFAELPLALNDVVSANTEERWLEGALVAREGDAIHGALFFAPEGTSEVAVAVFAPPRREILWLRPTPMEAPREPPTTLEIEGRAYQLAGRVPVRITREGRGAPNVGENVMWAVYEGGGMASALLLTGGIEPRCWVGERLDPGQYDRMGGGGAA